MDSVSYSTLSGADLVQISNSPYIHAHHARVCMEEMWLHRKVCHPFCSVFGLQSLQNQGAALAACTIRCFQEYTVVQY